MAGLASVISSELMARSSGSKFVVAAHTVVLYSCNTAGRVLEGDMGSDTLIALYSWVFRFSHQPLTSL